MSRLTRLLTSAALCCLPAAGEAEAEAEALLPLGVNDMLLPELTSSELAEQRGGFNWQGINIRFGAEVRSYLNDELVLQTSYNWTEVGAETRQIVSPKLVPEDHNNLRPDLPNNQYLVRSNKTYLFTNNGQTAFFHETGRSLRNIVINTMSNAVIRQQVDAELNIGNFQEFSSYSLTQHILSNLSIFPASASMRR